MVGTGTAWVLLAVNDRLAAPVIDEAFVCHHVVDGLCGQILSLVNGGSSFTWALNLTGLGGQGPRSHRSACWSPRSRAAPGSASGRSWSPRACRARPGNTGPVVGAAALASPGRRAAGGGRGAGLRTESVSRFPAQAGWPVERLVMGGGAAASRVTTQIMADVTGLPLACLNNERGQPAGRRHPGPRPGGDEALRWRICRKPWSPPRSCVEPGALRRTFYQRSSTSNT